MIKELKNWSIALTVIVSTVLTGCKSDEESTLLEHVPCDAKSMVTVNFKNILLQSGGDIEASGKFGIPESWSALMQNSGNASMALVEMICEEAPYIDTEKIIWYSVKDMSKPSVMFYITDLDKFRSDIASGAETEKKIGKYSIFAMKEFDVVVTDHIGWITADAEYTINMDKDIKDNHLASFDPIRVYLERDDHDIEFVINSSADWNDSISYVLGYTSFKNTGIITELSFMNADGEIYRFNNNIHEVERNLLSYVPNQTQLLFAIGPVENWNPLFNALDKFMPTNEFNTYALYYQIAKEYISRIDKTTMIALAPIAGRQALKNFSLDTWQVLFMSHLPQEQTDDLISLAKTFVISQSMPLKEISPDIYATRLNGVEVLFGEIDGYIFFSNYDLMEGGNTDLATAYESKRAVAQFLVPYESETMNAYNLPWGIDFNISLNSSNLMFVLRLPGSNGTVLSNLLDYFASAGSLGVDFR